MTRTSIAVPAFLALSALAAGCGSKTLDGKQIEDQIKSSGTAYTSVDCPDEIDAKKGYTFTCDAKTTKGDVVVTVKIDSVDGDKGHMTIVNVQPKK